MAAIDLHDKPFDEVTQIKLTLFESYAQAWIPTFLMTPFAKELHIFDFFAGTGYDLDGNSGSPIKILDKVIEQKELILQKDKKVVLHFNEFNFKKFKLLKEACENKVNDNGLLGFVDLKLYNEDFAVLFPELLKTIKKHPALVFLDQNGVKYISDDYFSELEKMHQTDFIYFLSSSYIKRFISRPEFMKHLNLDYEEIKRSKYSNIHRIICEQLKKNLPLDSKLKLYPFSLKKGVNIHGLIFGSKHPSAVDKFLNIAWKLNDKNGDANFDIDDEANANQLDLFTGERRLTKKQAFQEEVKAKVLNGEIESNKQLLEFTYEKGHIGKHAQECLKKLKKERKIEYNGRSPLVTYNNVFKDKKIIHYEKI
ncbi:three-Cys-motif partner protein TcmP [Brumimicrobium aurantiacum]|uniref:Three-Cys-motif partner protein TcmP n=1 Tax=Brumimicrobium aurantiacum TaxID=1737063 RepID=A0A3E1EZF1_9FLAO|nr:three-Cys-motif partner protein TcmP [Brumimicrobium aurantiacum]RFC54941.1 three-Cys-motif partner protein TcmP [Brumimicrobium aurantiacum]